MRTEDALARLAEHQQRILALVAQARALVDGEADEARAPLARLRWELVRLLRGYQLFKHGEIFDPVIAAGNAARSRQAHHLKAACLTLGEEMQAHVAAWSAPGVGGEWGDYRAAVLAMVDRIRRHFDAERVGVAALLDGLARTRER